MRPSRAARTGAALAAGGLLVAACSSGGPRRVGSATTSASPSTTARPAGTTAPGQLPTVFDCGGGAYEPATLLVVCGNGTTTATAVKWTSWTGSGAAGSGEVHLPGKAPAPARLALSEVVATSNGPQFSRLEADWIGSSPDGRPVDYFMLSTAPGA